MAVKMAAKTRLVAVKLTPEQYRVMALRAERCGLRMGTWMRSILIQAATRPSNDGHLRIKEPDGALG